MRAGATSAGCARDSPSGTRRTSASWPRLLEKFNPLEPDSPAAHYSLGAALDAINAALADEETGTRRYIRAQIEQERGELDAALADYEFVLTWGLVYPYPFIEEAQARYAEVLEDAGQR